MAEEKAQKRDQTYAAPLHQVSDPHLVLPLRTPLPLHDNRSLTLTSVDQQSYADRTTTCRANCKCACHKIQRSSTPSFLSGILGQLFVEHAGIPTLNTKCNTTGCINPQGSQLYAEYWLPSGALRSQIVRFCAAYHTNSGPSFQLRTLRRVPDSAPAVSFAMNGNIQGLQDLFNRGEASPQDVSDTRGYSLLRWALYSRQYKTLRFLHGAGADADYRPKALHDNSPSNKAADALMMGGLTSDVVEDLSCIANKDWADEQDFPLLHRIVLGLHGKDLEQALAEDPTAVNHTDAMGRTALNWAAARGDNPSITTLLHHAADPNILDRQHSGSLSYAAEKNHTTCVLTLLTAGAHTDPPIPGHHPVGTPLNCAARNASDPALVEALLASGASVDAAGIDGRTPLHHAAHADNASFARLLLAHGADADAVSAAGHTPLTAAVVANSHGVLRVLLLLREEGVQGGCLRAPGLLDAAARYADCETLGLLGLGAGRVRLEGCGGMGYYKGEGGLEEVLRRRYDGDEKLGCAFADFLAAMRERELGEKGVAGGGFSGSTEHLLD
ncbi:ankyrin repeat-containing domain protein [Chaetomium fimeti]|uniref:Ankyrin repeat-containing domain protein n=1 Tax=Chaetomium fimeti TaxID=1854472 RepID=A0AAE0HMI2_9PEZI|nr:ankyrin repeat-containing domain protein [Chaetomium fimeti]